MRQTADQSMSFFTPERTRALLQGRRESVGNVLAALLGVVTPFCSCSAVPLFIGFVTTGVPLAVLIGVPMYSNAAGIIPVVQALLAACRASPSMLLNKRRTPFGWRTNITRKLLNVERGVASYQYARTLCRLGPPDADVSAL
jgi:predicted PurR-regulated permease PerM